MTAEDLIKLYRECKEKKDLLDAQHKAKLADLLKLMEKLEGKLDKFLTDHKVLNFKTSYGTAYIKTRWSASLVNPDDFMGYVVDSGEWNLLDRKANVTAVRAYADKHKELPPGAKLSSRRVVHVVKAGATVPSDDE